MGNRNTLRGRRFNNHLNCFCSSSTGREETEQTTSILGRLHYFSGTGKFVPPRLATPKCLHENSLAYIFSLYSQ